MSAPAWYVWGPSEHPIDWDDEPDETSAPQKFYEGNDPQRYDETRGYALADAVAEGDPNALAEVGYYDEDPPPDPETDSAEELEEIGYYDEQRWADDAEAPS